MKPTLEALLDNFKERNARKQLTVKGKYAYCDGHDALAPLLVKAVEDFKTIERSSDEPHTCLSATNAILNIEAALAQGTEARGEGEKK